MLVEQKGKAEQNCRREKPCAPDDGLYERREGHPQTEGHRDTCHASMLACIPRNLRCAGPRWGYMRVHESKITAGMRSSATGMFLPRTCFALGLRTLCNHEPSIATSPLIAEW